MMKDFYFKARNNTNGALSDGIRAAISSNELYSILTNEGYTPVSISEVPESEEHIIFAVQSRRPSSKSIENEKLIFCQQVYSLLDAGATLVEAVDTVIKTIKNRYFKKILNDVLRNICDGMLFTKALNKYKDVFSSFFIGVIKIGEKTGNMSMAFNYLSKFLLARTKNRYKIRSTLRYPLILITLIMGLIVLTNVYYYPALEKLYKMFKQELPLIANVNMMIGGFLIQYWHMLIAGLILFFIFGKSFLKVKQLAIIKDKFKFRLPVLGWFYKRISLVGFCDAFATTINAGYPQNEGLNLARTTLENKYFMKIVENVSKDISMGKTFYQAVASCNFFPAYFLQLIKGSEKSGDLTKSLYFIVDYYSETIAYDYDNIVEYLRPVLLIIIGAFLLFVILAILLPYYNLVFIALDTMRVK